VEAVELKRFYQGRKAFVTGQTGFKGAWLAWWLKELGASVSGFALPPEDQRGNLFKQTGLAREMHSIEGDLADLDALTRSLRESGADIVFHLAAQPIVIRGYEDPVGTFAANAQGTVHLLEAVRRCPAVKAVVAITTDKCYENLEQPRPYHEEDRLGGRDPYSASKAMAELAISAYRRSYFHESGVGLASGRAGNVIGGGDWAAHRIIPDIVQAIGEGRPVVLRHPAAVRPWQHVLDALHGYIILGAKLRAEPAAYGEAFNFSPSDTTPEHHVEAITQRFIAAFGKGAYEVDPATRRGHEAGYLALDPAKAQRRLGWKPKFSTDQALAETAAWYAAVQAAPDSARQRVLHDIHAFMDRT
jgi:CDP-glucose 4,6-dehydratase